MQLFMGHIVPCLYFIERENIFSSCISSTWFFFKKTWFVSFYLSPPLLFFPKTVFPKNCFVFPIFIGGEKFSINLYGSQGELLLFIGGVISIFYRVELFCLLLILYCLLSFIVYVYSLLSCLCQYVTKRGRSR